MRNVYHLMVIFFSIPYQLIGYLDPVEGAKIPYPIVEIKGRLIQHTFPGIPNYESIDNGDMPEKRYVLEIPKSAIDQLKREGCLPQDDIFSSEEKWWIQLDSEMNLDGFLNREVTVVGYLGSRVVHVHTPVAIEVINLSSN